MFITLIMPRFYFFMQLYRFRANFGLTCMTKLEQARGQAPCLTESPSQLKRWHCTAASRGEVTLGICPPRGK